MVINQTEIQSRLRGMPAYRRGIYAFRLAAVAIILLGLAVLAGFAGVRGVVLMAACGAAFMTMLTAVALNWTSVLPLMRARQEVFGPGVSAYERSRIMRVTLLRDAYLPRAARKRE